MSKRQRRVLPRLSLKYQCHAQDKLMQEIFIFPAYILTVIVVLCDRIRLLDIVSLSFVSILQMKLESSERNFLSFSLPSACIQGDIEYIHFEGLVSRVEIILSYACCCYQNKHISLTERSDCATDMVSTSKILEDYLVEISPCDVECFRLSLYSMVVALVFRMWFSHIAERVHSVAIIRVKNELLLFIKPLISDFLPGHST